MIQGCTKGSSRSGNGRWGYKRGRARKSVGAGIYEAEENQAGCVVWIHCNVGEKVGYCLVGVRLVVLLIDYQRMVLSSLYVCVCVENNVFR